MHGSSLSGVAAVAAVGMAAAVAQAVFFPEALLQSLQELSP
jgi:hypothetical protein